MGKRHKPEEIASKLRQVDVPTSRGATVAEAIRLNASFAFNYSPVASWTSASRRSKSVTIRLRPRQ